MSLSRLLLSESSDPFYSVGSDLKVHEEAQEFPQNWNDSVINYSTYFLCEHMLQYKYVLFSKNEYVIRQVVIQFVIMKARQPVWHKVLCLVLDVRRRSYSNKTRQSLFVDLWFRGDVITML